MIVLQAILLEATSERFQYRVDVPGRRPLLSSDPAVVAEELKALGIAAPERLVAHVREWGAVEISQTDLAH